MRSFSLLLLVVGVLSCLLSAVHAQIVATGFSWAENLAFSSTENNYFMWVTDATRGELWKVGVNQSSTDSSTKYYQELYLSKNGITKFEGLFTLGTTVYAGATLDDGSHAIVTVPIPSSPNTYKVFAKVSKQPNGMVHDAGAGIIYYTDAGGLGSSSGALYAVNEATLEETTVKDGLDGADGLWLDRETGKLYLGQLTSKKIVVFDTSSGMAQYLGEYKGLNSLGFGHMLDDFTLYSYCSSAEYSCSQLLGADFEGKGLHIFGTDGQSITDVSPPAGIKFNQITSVRRGGGGGFDPNSFFVTEGGGATSHAKDRRVIEIPKF
jgi:hypothetical protein